MTDLLRKAIKEGRKIVFADEVMFTKQTSKAREWSCRRDNAKVDEAKCLTNYVAVIASISFERGLEIVDMHDDAVNTPLF
jgi:hypothetical protein